MTTTFLRPAGRRLFTLCLVLLGIASLPLKNEAALPPLVQLKNLLIPAASYGIYSIAVDQYAKRTLKIMKAAEEEVSHITDARDFDDESIPLLTPTQLRNTISKRTNLVTNPLQRKSWRKWRLTTRNNNNNNKGKNDDSNSETASNNNIEPGQKYEFAYRSYPNIEERDDVAVSFYNWKMFVGLKHSGNGEMIIHDQDATDKADNQYRVSLRDKFRLRLLTPVSITWHGTIRDPRGSKTPRITWNKTEMMIGTKKIERPAIAEKLASIPWDIVKCEDGMVCMQRGDVGYLVYDKCQQ